MRLFIAGLATETNTFSPIPTDRSSFEEFFCFRAGTLPADRVSTSGPLNAAHERVASDGLQIVQGLFAAAAPSAPVRQADYEALRDELLDDLRRALPVDIVLLDLHGAMVAQRCDDCEGDLLGRVRALVGPGVVIGAELDPHCHLSEAMCTHADLLVLYKEYPHTDVLERGRELLDLALRTARGQVRPRMASFDCRMIGLYYTHREPMRGFVRRMQEMERLPGVLSVSLGHGFPWGDVPDMGTRVLVLTDDLEARAPDGTALASALGADLQALRGSTAEHFIDAAEAARCAQAATCWPVVIADSADNPGAGAPGDSTHLLHELLARHVRGIAAGVLWDPGAVALASRAGVGSTLPLRIGGKVAASSGAPLDLLVTVLSVDHAAWQCFAGGRHALGTLVAVRAGELTLLLGSVRAQCFDRDVFTRAGVDLRACRVVVVKSMQHFHASFAPIAAELHYTTTAGTHPFDLRSIEYRRVRRPIWPLDPLGA